MGNSASEIGSKDINRQFPAYLPPSKLKIYGFAIAIIVGIGGLAVGAAGLASYFHLGALSNIAQIDAMIMMAAGGGGTLLFIVGVVGTVKQPKIDRQKTTDSIDTQGGLVYGKDAWQVWGVEILDAVPPAPQVDLRKKDKILLYMPQNIRFKGKKQNLTLNFLKEMSSDFDFLSPLVKEQFGDTPAAPGWILIDRAVIPESEKKKYETQKKLVDKRGCNMPTVLEAALLNLIVRAFTGEHLHKNGTFCVEKIKEQHPVAVMMRDDGLYVDSRSNGINSAGKDRCGVVCVQRRFSHRWHFNP